MVATKSTMIPLGTKAHSFQLQDPRTNNLVEFSDETEGKGFLFAFICNHCPFVVHLKEHFSKLFNSWVEDGMKVYAISANDSVKYPDDHPEKMAQEATKLNFNFPYLHDESQAVAKAYHASCTPDFFLFNERKELFYRGQYDDSRPNGNNEVTGQDLSHAVQLMLKGENPPTAQSPSIGCNIKWK